MLIFLATHSKVLFHVSDDLGNVAELCASLLIIYNALFLKSQSKGRAYQEMKNFQNT